MTCCIRPLLNRKRTFSATGQTHQSESMNLQPCTTERFTRIHRITQLSSVITQLIGVLVVVLVINRLQEKTGFTVAFTTLHNVRYPTCRHVRATAAAGNAEMDYRQKPNPNNNEFNDSSGYENSGNYAKSWKEVPGGFVPQLGNNIAFTKIHPIDNQSTAPTDVTQPVLNQSSLPSPPSSSSMSSSSPMKKNTTPTTMRIRQLSNIKDYKHYVVDDVDPNIVTITVVRFYAPWCRACQAIQQRYYRLAQQYEQRMQPQPLPVVQANESSNTMSRSSLSSPSNVLVRFMECPVTKDNAMLHQGLGVPSLPYGHIYHSRVGLVEEMKLNKNVFTNFESTLASHVNGYCTVIYEDDDNTTNDTTGVNQNHTDIHNVPSSHAQQQSTFG